MTKFKESIKNVINSPKLKAVAEHPITKFTIPVATTAVTASLAAKRIINDKKQHEEQMEEYEKMEKKLDKLEKEVKKEKKRIVFRKKKEKDFSVTSGGYNKPEPKSLIIEGLKKVAFDSKLRTPDKEGSKELIEAIKDYPNVTFNKSVEDSYDSKILHLHQCGDVLIIYSRSLYSTSAELEALNKILNTYCKSFDNTDYSSTCSGSTAFIELWIADNTMEYLIKKFKEAGFILNILV